MSHKIKKLINFSGFKRSFLWVVIGVEGDRGGGSPGEKGREAGGERAGSGILKVAGTGRKRVKLRNISIYFGRQTGEIFCYGYRKGWEAEVKSTGGGRFSSVPLHIGGF